MSIKAARFRQTYKCAADGCSWKIHASKLPCRNYLMVKTYNPQHQCQAVRNNRITSATWIARVLASDLRDDPNMKLGVMRQKLKDKFGLTDILKAKLFRARVKA